MDAVIADADCAADLSRRRFGRAGFRRALPECCANSARLAAAAAKSVPQARPRRRASGCSCFRTESRLTALRASMALSRVTSIRIFLEAASRRRSSAVGQDFQDARERIRCWPAADCSLSAADFGFGDFQQVQVAARDLENEQVAEMIQQIGEQPAQVLAVLRQLVQLAAAPSGFRRPARRRLSSRIWLWAARPNMESTSASSILSPQKLMSWSSVDSASRIPPSAPRAMA